MAESDDGFVELHVPVPSLILRQSHGFWLFTMPLHPEFAGVCYKASLQHIRQEHQPVS